MFEFKNIIDYLSVQIDILFMLKIKDPKKKLTSKLKLFYIYNIILNAKGIDVTSIDASEMLRDYMKWKFSDNVYTYRTQLKNMGWLIDDDSTKGGYNILPIFRTINFRKKYMFEISCTQSLNEI